MDWKLNRYLFVVFYFRIYMWVPECAAITSAIRWARFQRTVALDDHTCAPGDGIFMEDINDPIRCALMCMHASKCYTMFYDSSKGKCSGCTGVYSVASPPSIYVGNIHYQIYPSCGDGWHGYMRSCYILSAHDTFYNGAAECVAKGGHAVYIESSAENEFIKSALPADISTWAWYIGITDCADNGIWRQYGTEELALFTDFEASEPNNNNEECCGLMFLGYGYQWADWPCIDTNNGYPTICEMEIQY